MPASLAPGTSASPMAPRVAACSGVSVRSGIFCACASRGVSKTSAPPTENASAPIAAPFMKARRCISSMIFLPSPQALCPPFGTGQNSTLKWTLNQADSGAAASLRLIFGGMRFLRTSFLRTMRGVRHRRAAWPRRRRPKTRPGAEKFAKHLVGLERVAAGVNQQVDLIRRQLQPRLDGGERRRAIRAQLIERNAADKEFHVLAIPSRRHAEASALGFGEMATPIHQIVAPLVHGGVERGLAADGARA